MDYVTKTGKTGVDGVLFTAPQAIPSSNAIQMLDIGSLHNNQICFARFFNYLCFYFGREDVIWL